MRSASSLRKPQKSRKRGCARTNNLAPDAFGRPCPFGGRVSVQGAPLIGHSYKVEVIPEGSVVPVPVVHDLVVTHDGDNEIELDWISFE